MNTKSVSIVAVFLAVAAAAWIFTSGENEAAEITVYKSPECGCCSSWAGHLRNAGYSVEVKAVDDMEVIKETLGVPESMQSCHTAKVGGYVVEGHVPAEDIEWLLSERPDVKGLAVPGMPMGSLGMEGGEAERYNVMLLKSDGSVSIRARH